MTRIGLASDYPAAYKSPEPPLALSVPLSRFTLRVGGGSATLEIIRVCTH
jgi:hypothetical protein